MGVYVYPLQSGFKVAKKSDSYTVSSDLFCNDAFWTLKFELQVMRDLSQTYGGISPGGGEWALPIMKDKRHGPFFFLTAAWIHAVRLDELEPQGGYLALDRNSGE